jgi:hypothetical protein
MVDKIGQEATTAQKAIAKAREEIEQEELAKGVKALKVKYRELKAAETVVSNIKREIADLEEAIEQGNV